MSEFYNLQDELAKDKIEASSYLIYRKEYREISCEAKIIYQYLLKRYSVSEFKRVQAMKENTMDKFTFIDEKGNLFCFCSNDELRFITGASENTVVKAKKELQAVELLEEVKQSAHKTNRIYVKKVEMDVKDNHQFKADLAAFKEEEAKKRKEKNAKRKEKKTNVENEVANDTKKVNRKKSSSVNRKNYSSVNRKIYGHSTKEEGLSTKEFKSTKESISLEDTLNELLATKEMPTLAIKQIQMNQKRLTDNNISPYDILSFYKSTDNTLPDNDFTSVLTKVLKAKGNIGNFHAYMKKAVKTWYEEYSLNEEDNDEVVYNLNNASNPIFGFNPFEG